MKYWISILLALAPLLGIAQQSESLVFCEYPDTEAQPPFRINELLHIILDNQDGETPACIVPDGRFYYNIIILADGSVSSLNLECVDQKGNSCFLSFDDPSKLEKWIPATQNGENCNQKMRLRISCILFN